jgi:hypothetical protein
MTSEIPSTRRSGRTSTPFRYCNRDVDRFGNERYYVRIPGLPKYRMTAPYLDERGSITAAFAEEYHRVIAGDRGSRPLPPTRVQEGTVLWLVETYYRSKLFQTYSAATKNDKKSVLNRYCAVVGDLPFKKMRKLDVEASQMKRSQTPGAADKLVKYLKALFNWAMKEGFASFNPAEGVTKIHKSDGFHSWSEIELDLSARDDGETCIRTDVESWCKTIGFGQAGLAQPDWRSHRVCAAKGRRQICAVFELAGHWGSQRRPECDHTRQAKLPRD